MATSVEDIVNQALDQVGYPRRIGDIYEGSAPARVALEVYGQIRDEILRSQDWPFSRRVATLTLLKGPPPAGGFTPTTPWTNIYPYAGFLFEYAYLADCLDLRDIIQPPLSMPDLDPVPANWRVDNDPVPNVSGNPPVASGPPAKVILSNTTSAMAIYRAQITDVTQWDSEFTKAVVDALAVVFSKAFNLDQKKELDNEARAGAALQDVRG